MAKKGGANRTARVRDYMTAHPEQSNAEVFHGLEAEGVHVSRSLVSQVRKRLGMPQSGGTKKRAGKKKVGRKKMSRKKTTMARSTGRGITAEDLLEAKKLADELGGLDRVREALDALERLR